MKYFSSAVAATVVQWSDLLTTEPEVQVGFPALPDYLRSSENGDH
jgi:hypothetical protein